jgi:hypothetical protein
LPLRCLSFFDLRILITPLVSSNSSKYIIYINIDKVNIRLECYRSWVRTPMTIKSIFVGSPLGTHNLGTTSKNVKVQYGEMLDLSILFAVLNVRHEETASVSVLSSRCGRSCVRAPVGSNQRL